MKLIDYLAKRKQYKELRRQLKEIKDDYKLTVTTFVLYKSQWPERTIEFAREKIIKQKKQITFLEQELLKIWKGK